MSLAFAVACGETFSTFDGSGGSGGTTGSGASAGDAGTGGVDGGTGGAATTCASHSGCLVVLDSSDPCFDPDCSAPRGATVQEVAGNPCLLLWDNRHDPVPEGCASEEQVFCPEICIQPPECVRARCIDEGCALEVGYSAEECAPPDDDHCAELAADLNAAVQQARECTLLDTSTPPNEGAPERAGCTADANVQDACNCLIVVNADATELVKAAQGAYEDWSNAGCYPDDGCGPCPRGTKGQCIIGIVGDTGTCEPLE